MITFANDRVCAICKKVILSGTPAQQRYYGQSLHFSCYAKEKFDWHISEMKRLMRESKWKK